MGVCFPMPDGRMMRGARCRCSSWSSAGRGRPGRWPCGCLRLPAASMGLHDAHMRVWDTWPGMASKAQWPLHGCGRGGLCCLRGVRSGAAMLRAAPVPSMQPW